MFFGFNGLAKRTGIGGPVTFARYLFKKNIICLLLALLMVATRSHDHKASKMQLEKCFGLMIDSRCASLAS